MNPKGLNLTDVWDDIPPVRHWKFKSKKRKANALSTKLLERIIDLVTNPGDLVLDPFGGSGTTFAVCEKKGRRWIGVEIESVDVIIDRLQRAELSHYKNDDFVEPHSNGTAKSVTGRRGGVPGIAKHPLQHIGKKGPA